MIHEKLQRVVDKACQQHADREAATKAIASYIHRRWKADKGLQEEVIERAIVQLIDESRHRFNQSAVKGMETVSRVDHDAEKAISAKLDVTENVSAILWMTINDKFLADCTQGDLRAAAQHERKTARGNMTKAFFEELVANELKPNQTVRRRFKPTELHELHQKARAMAATAIQVDDDEQREAG